MGFLSLSTDTGERHFVSWDVLSGVGQVGEKMLGCPGDSSIFHCFTIVESSASSSSTYEATEGRSSCTFTITLNYHKST